MTKSNLRYKKFMSELSSEIVMNNTRQPGKLKKTILNLNTMQSPIRTIHHTIADEKEQFDIKSIGENKKVFLMKDFNDLMFKRKKELIVMPRIQKQNYKNGKVY